mmetsp:Transcript_19010/g.27928  ORF Transcript_19010/g.27928 Transcript_19010/m.27928 type:complete len:107 (-) Transcript_19010:829-1149(-)
MCMSFDPRGTSGFHTTNVSNEHSKCCAEAKKKRQTQNQQRGEIVQGNRRVLCGYVIQQQSVTNYTYFSHFLNHMFLIILIGFNISPCNKPPLSKYTNPIKDLIRSK